MSFNGNSPIGFCFQNGGDFIECWFGFLFQLVRVRIEINAINAGASKLLQVFDQLCFQAAQPVRAGTDITALLWPNDDPLAVIGIHPFPPDTDCLLAINCEHHDRGT